jgi:two-component system OmpR family response regulator
VVTQKEGAAAGDGDAARSIHTRDALQDALYGFEDEGDSNTLEVFVSRLRATRPRAHPDPARPGYRLAFSAAPP